MALHQEKIYTIEDIYALPDGQRAELIDGRIYMMAPPSARHQDIVFSFKDSKQYCYENEIPVCIYKDLKIRISDLLSSPL